jgi:hypothetical protein
MVRGLVSSSWKRIDDSLVFEVSIPVNSEAKVNVLRIGLRNIEVTESGKTVWKNGKFIQGASGIANGTETAEYLTFDVGSGSYSFRLKGQKQLSCCGGMSSLEMWSNIRKKQFAKQQSNRP